MDGQIAAVEISVAQWLFGGLIAVILGIGGWLWLQLVGKVSDLDRTMSQHEEEFSDYKLDSERRYAKQDSVNVQFEKLMSALQSLQRDLNTQSVSMASLAANLANTVNSRN